MCRKGLKSFFHAYFETSPLSRLRCYDSHTAVLGIFSDRCEIRLRQQPSLVRCMLIAPVFKALLKSGLLIPTHSFCGIPVFWAEVFSANLSASPAIYVVCMNKAEHLSPVAHPRICTSYSDRRS